MSDTITQTDTSTELHIPSLWNVVLLNDDFTPMDFVTEVLMDIFNKSEAEAIELMLTVHNAGQAVVGTYTRDIAETKASKAMRRAEREEHPLRVVAQPST